MAAAGITATVIPGGVLAAAKQADPGAHSPASRIAPDRIADLAAALYYDVDEIFRFVADSIRYEPYAGILRGADGTLVARAGNSADQAALLAALLDASLINHRFALGRLDAQAADSILASAVTDAATAEQGSLDALAGVLPGQPLSPAPELDPETRAALERTQGSADQVVDWAREQVTNTMSDIQTTLSAAGMVLPGGFSETPIREIDRHVWVQIAQGPDWVDLDPSVPGNPPGQAMATAADTLDTLPDELRHGVDLAVIGESLSGGVLSTETLLSLTTHADRLAGLPITFLNANPAGVERLAEAVTPIDGVRSYVPTIVIGEEGFAGRPISFWRAGALESDLLDGGSLFEGSGGTGETTAEWLEATITSPDREPVVVRRAIFDRLGPAARASGLTGEEPLTPATQVTLVDDSMEILPALASTWFAVNVGLPERSAPILRQTDDDTGVGAVFAYGQHVFRELGDLVLGLPLGSRSFIDAPNLVAYTVAPKKGTDGLDRVESAVDIWHRSHGTMPVTDVAAQMPPTALAGVLDHVIERVIGEDVARPPAVQDRGIPVSVGAVFDAARRDGVELRGVRTPSDVDDLSYPAAARAVLSAALGDGWLAVAPERPVRIGDEGRIGWWLVDPVSGQAVDQLDDGRGVTTGYETTLTPGQVVKEHALKKLGRECLKGAAELYGAVILNALAIDCIARADQAPKASAYCALAGGVGALALGGNSYHPLRLCVKGV